MQRGMSSIPTRREAVLVLVLSQAADPLGVMLISIARCLTLIHLRDYIGS